MEQGGAFTIALSSDSLVASAGGGQSTEGDPVGSGPPASLEAGPFGSLVAEMWRESPTFRRQCLRLADQPTLTVTVSADARGLRSAARATTSMSHKRGVLTRADIVLLSLADAIELIAHEIEHVIEQLDGIVLTGDCGRITAPDGRFETCRAVEAGRRVKQEVDEDRRGRMRVVRLDSSEGPFDPNSAAVSAGGRFVVLRSEARLVAEDINDGPDLYVLDLETGGLHLESPRPGWADGFSGLLHPRISGDGRFVAFQVVTDDSSAPDGRAWDIVVLDRGAARVRRIRAESGDGAARLNGTAVISADGQTVVFESTPRIARYGRRVTTDIYVVRLRTDRGERVSGSATASAASLGARPSNSVSWADRVVTGKQSPTDGSNITPAVSADGRFIAFTSTGDVTCRDIPACDRSAGAGSQPSNIYLRDTMEQVTTRITRSTSGGEPNGPSDWPSISADGRIVVFASKASNLVKGDGNGESDIFVHDTFHGTTTLVSHRPDGRSGNGASRHPTVSGDGATVAFQSIASDLLCTKHCTDQQRDRNLLWDVFVYERSARSMIRASGDEKGAWAESSHAPALDHSGRVLVFSSRHPVDEQDVNNDDDLHIWQRRPRD